MCNPALVVVGLQIAAAAAQYAQQADQANKQEKAIKEAADQNQEQLQEQRRQITQQEANNLFDVRRMQAREEAAVRTASGESGTGGLSLAAIINDTAMQAGFESSRIQVDAENARKQNTLEAKGVGVRAKGDINSIARPSAIGLGLQIAGAAAGGYANASALDSKITNSYTPNNTYVSGYRSQSTYLPDNYFR